MARPDSHSPGNAVQFAELARRDADQLTPGFSEARHARIMNAVDAGQIGPPRTLVLPSRPPRRWGLAAMGMAAGILLATFVGMRLMSGQGSPAVAPGLGLSKAPQVAIEKPMTKPAPNLVPAPALSVSNVPSHPDVPALSIDQVARQANDHVQEVVQTAMAQQQWAGLDQDVRAATQYLVDQVPLRSAWQSDGDDRR